MRVSQAADLASGSLKCVVIYQDTRFCSVILSGRIADLGL